MEWLLTRLNDFFSKFTIECAIPADKQMHFLSGASGSFLLSAFLNILSFIFNKNIPDIWIYSIVIICYIALLKENYDSRHPLIHTADIFDFIFTSIGAVTGGIVYFLITRIT